VTVAMKSGQYVMGEAGKGSSEKTYESGKVENCEKISSNRG